MSIHTMEITSGVLGDRRFNLIWNFRGSDGFAAFNKGRTHVREPKLISINIQSSKLQELITVASPRK